MGDEKGHTHSPVGSIDALSLHFSQNVRECRWVQAVSRPVEQRRKQELLCQRPEIQKSAGQTDRSSRSRLCRVDANGERAADGQRHAGQDPPSAEASQQRTQQPVANRTRIGCSGQRHVHRHPFRLFQGPLQLRQRQSRCCWPNVHPTFCDVVGGTACCDQGGYSGSRGQSSEAGAPAAAAAATAATTSSGSNATHGGGSIHHQAVPEPSLSIISESIHFGNRSFRPPSFLPNRPFQLAKVYDAEEALLPRNLVRPTRSRPKLGRKAELTLVRLPPLPAPLSSACPAAGGPFTICRNSTLP